MVAFLAPPPAHVGSRGDDDVRLRRMLDDHFDFVWRLLRRLGLADADADDATQQVFVVASGKLGAVREESERSFLIGTALRIAADIRRSAPRRREVPSAEVGIDVEADVRLDELVDQRRARAMLDAVLAEMDLDTRTVFVLFEIEEMTLTEIAEVLDVPRGTVASRLRRARVEFDAKIRRTASGPVHSSTIGHEPWEGDKR
jgi:RNA polymerase sigma-70 factor (ECF subfamily)